MSGEVVTTEPASSARETERAPVDSTAHFPQAPDTSAPRDVALESLARAAPLRRERSQRPRESQHRPTQRRERTSEAETNQAPATRSFSDTLAAQQKLQIIQRKEPLELLGVETRNRYTIQTENGAILGTMAETTKGWWGFLTRQLLGDCRRFETEIFGANGKSEFKLVHPFRLFRQRMEVHDSSGALIGTVQQRFGLWNKRFDILDSAGQVTMTVRSPWYRPWTFPLMREGSPVATLTKEWNGFLKEAFTDTDRFALSFANTATSKTDRVLALALNALVDRTQFNGG